MKPAKAKEHRATAEEKIKDAARRLFTSDGFDAVKTRDIAKEAGINLALLNYYFGSKEKLFHIIMTENLGHFFKGVAIILNDKETGFYKKIELLVEFYIARLMENPDVPLFVLNEARNDSENFPLQFNIIGSSYFMKQYRKEMKSGRVEKLNPGHLIINIMGLTIFPFAARPMVQRIRNITDKDYENLMLERKKLVPQWIKAILEIKK